MNRLAAAFGKQGEDATETVLTMLQAMTMKHVETYSIVSSADSQTSSKLRDFRGGSYASSVIGLASGEAAESDVGRMTKTGDAALVFDGRMYHTKESVLTHQTFTPKSLSDVTQFAKKQVRSASGDFAFAIAEPSRLVLGRDPIGMRPLYHGCNESFFAFASEKKALWAVGIRNAKSFPPGCVAVVDASGATFFHVRTLCKAKPRQTSMETASARLQKVLAKAVQERIASSKDVAVAFSGGIDSSLIASLAKKLGANAQLVHVSLVGQEETIHARKMADILHLPLHSFAYSAQEVIETVPKVLRLVEDPNAMQTSIGIPMFWTADRVSRLDLRTTLGGHGGDELFGGYKKYVDVYVSHGGKAVHRAMSEDAVNLHSTNLERDTKICVYHGIELRLPFLAFEVADFALRLPVELKLEPKVDTLRKLVLRHMASKIGLPDEIVKRPKKAMQYSTGVAKTLAAHARKKHISLASYLEQELAAALKVKSCYD